MMISFTAGVVLGVLYAPHKGTKTRRKLATVGRDVKDGWTSIADGISDRIDSIRGEVDSFSDTTVEEADASRFNVNDKAGFL